VVVRGPDGQQLGFTHNPDGSYVADAGGRARLTAVSGGYQLVLVDQTRYSFDTAGRLTTITDRNGKGLTVARGTDGKVATVTDAASRTITLTHGDAAGHLTRAALPDGRHVDYGYTGNLLTSVRDVRGGTTTYGYDGSNRLADITNQLGKQVVHNVYGSDGRVTQQTTPQGTTTFGFDAATGTATMTDARGKTWTDVYANEVLTQRKDPLGHTTSYTYDGNLNLGSVTTPRGLTTSSIYDGNANMLTVDGPAPSLVHQAFTYDGFNNVKTATDGRNNTTAYDYDPAGNLIKVTRPGTVVTQYGRDPAGTGLLASMTDPNSRTTTFGYNAAFDLTRVTTPKGEVTTMGYDTSGRMTSRVDPRGNANGRNPADYTWAYAHDEADHPTSVTDPQGRVWTSHHDLAGNRDTATDANNHQTTYTYTDSNDLQAVTAPAVTGIPGPVTTSYDYDPAGNLRARTDANGHVTTYDHDDAGRLTTATAPLGRVWTSGYDADGNRTSVTDANGNATPTSGDGTTTRGYDELGRLVSVTYSDATPAVSLGYDANGNRTSMTDGAGTETREYDPLNRLTKLTRGSDVFQYGYDPAGNLTSRTYPDNTVVTLAPDEDERLASVTAEGGTTSYAYDEAGNLLSTTLPAGNGYVETRTYDTAGRLASVGNAKGGTVLSSFAYTRDPVGNPTRVVLADGTTQTATYDELDRLTRYCLNTSCGTSRAYTYDKVGNRRTSNRSATVTSYAHDDADRLCWTATGTIANPTCASPPTGATIYGSDANGNQTSAGATTYSYDLADQLTAAVTGPTATTFAYDGDGARYRRVGQGATNTLVWDKNGPLPEVVLERNNAGSTLFRYTFGRAQLTERTTAGTFFFHHDGLGSTANLTNATGATQVSYAYDPFGALFSSTVAPGAPKVLHRFTGQYYDTTPNLYNLRARQYDPATGRFLQRDPVPSDAADGYTSAYNYALSNPLRFTDPSGQVVIGLCGSGTISIPVTFNLRGCIAKDEKGWGLVGTFTFGGAVGVGGAATGGVLISNADTFDQLRGAAATLGTIAGEGRVVEFDISSNFRTRNCENELVATGYAGLGFGGSLTPPAIPALAYLGAGFTGATRLSGEDSCQYIGVSNK